MLEPVPGCELPVVQDEVEQVLSIFEETARRFGLDQFRYIATNGVMPEARVQGLLERFDLIGLSCDGPPQIQDRQRPMAGGQGTAAALEHTAAAYIGGYEQNTRRFVVDLAHIQALRFRLDALPEYCAGCFNRFHCTRDCPDQCPREKQKPATQILHRGSDRLGTLGGYVIWGEQAEYRRVVEAVFSLKKAA
jgi:hypothetical protein